MNTNQLKKFAQEARRKLLEQVGARLSFVLTTDSAELREKTEQVKKLREELNRTTKEQLIEKVAYTWFNRLVALRFMDANDYQPLGLRIITPKEGYTIPELLDEAKRGNIPEDIKLKRQKVFDLLDNRIPSINPQNEAFKELLIAVCNHLNTIFPFLFERINDYSELLLPDDLTSDFSIVTNVREGMPTIDCDNVEIIGWLYQFYISEKKDEVIGSKTKVKKEDIPAATQLFTPRWIVEYMVQNTIGKLWLQNRPKSRLREHMPYFIESFKSNDFLKISSPEEIKLLDPACGSGHILVYAFELFTKIYEEEGYNTSDISKLIIEKNLHGFEIDERASQLSCLALMMKAREYEYRAFKKDLRPNILFFQDLNIINTEIKDILNSFNLKVSDEMLYDLLQMQQAENFGSLIVPRAQQSEIHRISEKLVQVSPNINLFQKIKVDNLINALKQLSCLGENYHCTSANPPYMGLVKLNNSISDFVKVNYPNSKPDLFSCFIERSLKFNHKNGFSALVTMESWMFLSDFETLRKALLKDTKIHSLSHFGWHIMKISFGTVSFILENDKPDSNCKGTYSYLEIDDIDKQDERPKVFPKTDNGRFKIRNQKDFDKIPSAPIGYWLSDRVIDIFTKYPSLRSLSKPFQGMSSSNNNRFLRFWHEIKLDKFTDKCYTDKESILSNMTWFPYNKGGSFRRWYGNYEYVVNWYKSGLEVKDFTSRLTQGTAVRIKSYEHYFKKSITWSALTAGNFAARYSDKGAIFDVSGSSVFPTVEELTSILGVLNSVITKKILEVLNPTLNFQVIDISRIPISGLFEKYLLNIVDELIEICKSEWNSKETSWDFEINELVRIASSNRFEIEIEEAYDLYKQYWKIKFFQIHKNEEELNDRLIKNYQLQGELISDVPFEEISILQEELDRKELRNLNALSIRDQETTLVKNYQDILLPFNAKEVLEQFLSYSVGCMFGRYSLDKAGIIFANQGETLQDYLQKITKTTDDCVFLPDEDNIIPVLDDQWFEDDIVGRFYQFLKVTFGENNINKNIAFIEEQLGKDIRKYFIKDFYQDHIQRYKKRPIYWMFSSPKCSFNVLIYMHRYTPDTVSNILNKYLKEFIGKLKTRIEHLQHIQDSGSPSEKIKAIKESESIDKMLVELKEYERDFLYPLATERIMIDLDDGVLVNYNKFGKAIKEVAGLNDSVTKKKVREFEWIDATQII